MGSTALFTHLKLFCYSIFSFQQNKLYPNRWDFEQQFSVFKQYYTYFHTFFYLYVFSKNTNNITKTTLSNTSLNFQNHELMASKASLGWWLLLVLSSATWHYCRTSRMSCFKFPKSWVNDLKIFRPTWNGTEALGY